MNDAISAALAYAGFYGDTLAAQAGAALKSIDTMTLEIERLRGESRKLHTLSLERLQDNINLQVRVESLEAQLRAQASYLEHVTQIISNCVVTQQGLLTQLQSLKSYLD
jgi:hypothetical protein